MSRMPKLSEFVEMAAAEFIRDTGHSDLSARWIAEFFEDNGVADAYPHQDLVAFAVLVEKALERNNERAGKEARLHLERIAARQRKSNKP